MRFKCYLCGTFYDLENGFKKETEFDINLQVVLASIAAGVRHSAISDMFSYMFGAVIYTHPPKMTVTPPVLPVFIHPLNVLRTRRRPN